MTLFADSLAFTVVINSAGSNTVTLDFWKSFTFIGEACDPDPDPDGDLEWPNDCMALISRIAAPFSVAFWMGDTMLGFAGVWMAINLAAARPPRTGA
jgi:hypothetical protein